MELSLQELERRIEAILFAAGEPVAFSRIAAVLAEPKARVVAALKNLSEYYVYARRGLRLLQLSEQYQLCSFKEYSDVIRDVLETRKPPLLSASALEALALIAYRQPVTKAYVEQVRGVDCSYLMNSLSEKRLICEVGRLDVPGRPFLYATTPDFLRCFGLRSLEELPSVPEFMSSTPESVQISTDMLPLEEAPAENAPAEVPSGASVSMAGTSAESVPPDSSEALPG